MAQLDSRILLSSIPLPSPREMADQRQDRDIRQQEVDLRRQEILQRRDALIEAARLRSQKASPEFDPKKAKEATEYQIFLGQTVADKLRLAQQDPSTYPYVRQMIGQIAGPEALSELPENYDEAAPVIAQHVAAWPAHAEALKTNLQRIETVDESGNPVQKFVAPKEGDTFPVQPKPTTAAAAQGFTLAPGGRRYDAQGKLVAEAPERPEKAGGSAGPKPRAVTSGDANKIAELSNSLKDLDTLSATLEGVKDATGPAAAAGAALPNFVTSLTGWGTTAKEKQAVIDRVKQVIGKALEGGVLRKEDEDKYKKILPVISDAPDVVTSKLAGLKQAIDQKREEHLSALEDAGYDVTKFRARASAPPPPPPPGVKSVTVTAPNGKTYTFPNQAQADVFKKRAGIK